MRRFTEKERCALEEFFTEFDVVAHSFATQIFSIDPFRETHHYESLTPYGKTISLDILYDEDILHTIYAPENDVDALLAYVMKWDEAGRPTPRDNTDFFA